MLREADTQAFNQKRKLGLNQGAHNIKKTDVNAMDLETAE